MRRPGFTPKLMPVAAAGILCCVGGIGCATIAKAHHSMAMFDRGRSVSIEGIVTEVEWSSPHVYLRVEAENDSGDVEAWLIESQPPSVMRRFGWAADTVTLGERVTVTGWPLREPGARLVLGLSLETSTGLSMNLGFDAQRLSVEEPGPERTEDVFGTWLNLLQGGEGLGPAAEFVVGPRTWALTEAGRQAVEVFDQAAMLPAAECVPFTAPFVMLIPDVKTIENFGETIVIRSEFDAVERTVYMNISSHEGAESSLQGHSIGHWDGDALVIDTARFIDHRVGNAFGLPSGPRKRLVERFELNPDGKSMTYRIELTDPDYLAEPVSAEFKWVYRPDQSYRPEPCSIENARRYIEQE